MYLTSCVTHGRLGALVQLGDSAFMSSLRQSGVVSPAHNHSHYNRGMCVKIHK